VAEIRNVHYASAVDTTLPKPKQMQRKAALAQLEVEELRAALAASRLDVAEESLESAAERLSALLDAVTAITERISAALDIPVGLSIEQTADRLQVAAPTVRKWLDEGFLKRVEKRKPAEVDPRSVVDVERVLRRVRESYPAGQWTKALAAFLHDQHVLGDDSFRRAVEEADRGELIEI
jgi:transposase